MDLFGEKREFYAVYEKIGTLAPSNSVKINGLKIGIVREVSFLNDKGNRILVKFHIQNNDVLIPENTVAKITTDLLGSASVIFELGDHRDHPAQNGDTLISEIDKDLQSKVDEQIAPLKIKTEQLISEIDSVVKIVQVIFNEDARENLRSSFTSIKRSFGNFEKTSLKIDTLIGNQSHKISNIFSKISSIVDNLEASNDDLTNMLGNFSNVSDSLAAANITQTIQKAENAMASVTEIVDKINRGEGSLGLLINNDSLYYNINDASYNLEVLLDDYKRNPHRYLHFSVFGRKVKKKVLKATDVFDDKEVEKIRKLIKE